MHRGCSEVTPATVELRSAPKWSSAREAPASEMVACATRSVNGTQEEETVTRMDGKKEWTQLDTDS